MLLGFEFVGLFFLIFLLSVVPLAFWIYSLVEVSRAPDAAFGPPWDNAKNMWLIGLAVSVVLPAGAIVTTVLWWTQGHGALRAGRPVPRPFWAPKPAYAPPPGYPPYQQAPPPQPPDPARDRTS
ncbi:MAG TPA: hypothetical protein VNA20_05780 [Frankiaceae bacterium]|nr:hypothetical protein [Frankiaceae bacterium]